MDVIAILKDLGMINQKFIPHPDGYLYYCIEEWDDNYHMVNVAQVVLGLPTLWEAARKAREISWVNLSDVRKIREKAGIKDDQKVIECPTCETLILLESES